MGRLKTNEKSILLVGNFFTSKEGGRGVSEDLAELLRSKAWSVLSTSKQQKKLLRLLDMVYTAIKHHTRYQIANIDVYSGKAFIWAELMGCIFWLLKKPFICTLHGGNLARFETTHPRRVRRLFLLATQITTPSKYLQNYFSNLRQDVAWVPNGIDLRCYTYIKRESIEPKLIWLRAIHEIYAPFMAVEVVNLLRQKFPNITLTMVGPDKGDGSIILVKQLIETYELNNVVRIIGGVEKQAVPYWLNQGDIFINTTRIESFGVSVIEAAACGLPIVTTDAGELPFLWENNINAVVVPKDNVYAMADAVTKILKNPQFGLKLSRNAREKAEGYDWASVFPQWETLFESVIPNDQYN